MKRAKKNFDHEFRKRIIEMTKKLKNKSKVAKLLGISRGCIQGIMKKYEEFGYVEDKPRTGCLAILDEKDSRRNLL